MASKSDKKIIEVVIGSKITIKNFDELPSTLMEMLRSVGKYSNPDYYSKKAIGLWTGDTKKNIYARNLIITKNNDRYMQYQRGLWSEIKQEVKNYNLICAGTGLPQFELKATTVLEEHPILFPDFKLTLEDYQQIAQNDALRKSQGIISFPPGGGKTILAASVMSKLNQRTLVVTHTEALVNQWANSLTSKSFDNLSMSMIKDGTNDQSGKHVVISTVQSSECLVKNGAIGGFGSIFLDECHHVAAPTFLEVVGRCSAKNRYGLSASLKRKDKKHFLMNAVFGEVLVNLTYDDIKGRISLPSVHKVEITDIVVDPSKLYIMRSVGGVQTPFLDYVKLYTWMCEHEGRNDLLLRLIYGLATDQANHILVLTKRRDHAVLLQHKLGEFGVTAGLLLGGGSAKYRREKEDILKRANEGSLKVIIGTSIADEGLDIAILNRLVLTCPSSFDELLRQRIGRISRKIPGKAPSIVYDIADLYIPELADSWNNRGKFYDKLGMEVNIVSPTIFY